MTRYTVVWSRGARDQSIEIWIAARDRREVTAAVDAIDRQLAIDGPFQGVEVAEELRALLVPPLRVLFAVREDDRVVEVVRVRRV